MNYWLSQNTPICAAARALAAPSISALTADIGHRCESRPSQVGDPLVFVDEGVVIEAFVRLRCSAARGTRELAHSSPKFLKACRWHHRDHSVRSRREGRRRPGAAMIWPGWR
jgi:hypothetical protein